MEVSLGVAAHAQALWGMPAEPGPVTWNLRAAGEDWGRLCWAGLGGMQNISKLICLLVFGPVCCSPGTRGRNEQDAYRRHHKYAQKCKCCIELEICAFCTADVLTFITNQEREAVPQKRVPRWLYGCSPVKLPPDQFVPVQPGDLRYQVVFYYTMCLYRDVQGCLSIRTAATFTLSCGHQQQLHLLVN